MWIITQLSYDNVDNKGVVAAHWRYAHHDGKFGANVEGSCNFTPDPDDPNYIPFENLTHDIVLEWVHAAIDKDEIEARVLARVEKKKANAATNSNTGLPWL